MRVNSIGEHRAKFYEQLRLYPGLCIAVHKDRGVIIAAKSYDQVVRRVALLGLENEVIVDVLPNCNWIV